MLKSQPAPWVHCHTIIGVIPDKGILGKVVGEGDGVVSYASAHLDHVDSEIVVNADHTTVHSHPLTVWKCTAFCWRIWPKSIAAGAPTCGSGRR